MIHNEFEKEEKYKLYRTVREILHPTISKKNISNYKIIVGEEYIPLRVAYPKKVSNIKDVIIYVHGNSIITSCEEKYSEISTNLAKDLDNLVISIDYEEASNLKKLYDTIFETIKFLHEELLRLDIRKENITIAGDSTGGSILLNLLKRLNEELHIERLILFYPVISGKTFENFVSKESNSHNVENKELLKKLHDYYKRKPKEFYNNENAKDISPKTLILCGNVDPLIEEIKEFSNSNDNITLTTIPFASHGFLNTKDKEIIREYNNSVRHFLEDKDNE